MIRKPNTHLLRAPFWFALCLFLSFTFTVGFAAEPKRVLLLHSFSPDVKPWSDYARIIRSELNQRSLSPLDIYEQSLTAARFNDENSINPFIAYLRALFSKKPPDLIISIGGPAAAFIQQRRPALFPGAPMLLTVVDQSRVRNLSLTDNDAVAPVSIDCLLAFENILNLLPDTKSVMVVLGNTPLEKFWKTEMSQQLAPLADRIKLEWTDDLSFSDILARAAALPPHTAIFWALMVADATGVPYEQGAALAKLRTAAAAPIFSYTDAFFNGDIVGGPHVPVQEAGQRAAQAAMRILNGEKPADIKISPVGMDVPKYDWRQLQRWEISESRLPPNSQILFRDQSAWERYRWQIIVIGAAILFQALLIQALLYQRYRRREAEVEAHERMSELAHINRQSVASGMSAAIAHELNQPLCAILNNTETAQAILKSDNPDIAELKEILSDIRSDDWRAGEIIRRMRSLVSKNSTEFKLIDFNEIVRDSIAITTIQARANDIKIYQNLNAGELLILGDAIQLQQVVVNLIMNSIDAVADPSNSRREIIIETKRLSGMMLEFSILDSGPGISPNKLAGIFEPFMTTKPTGMGMGLSIARMIVRSHEGKIWAENTPGGGASFRLQLRAAR